MTKQRIGILHPGAMGISIAASAQNGGNEVYWASQGRSPETGERAARFDLRDAQTLERLCAVCSIIISVCPPHAAEEVAGQVRHCGFNGLYLDANAISPQGDVSLKSTIGMHTCRFARP
jgi:3-hydroxyisobutyrate dehydrogenase-like beta-hydroxyacid dehydrogenase